MDDDDDRTTIKLRFLPLRAYPRHPFYRPILHYKFNLKRRRMAHILGKRHEIIFFFVFPHTRCCRSVVVALDAVRPSQIMYVYYDFQRGLSTIV